MKKTLDYAFSEPVWVQNVIVAGIALLTAFGLSLTAEQTSAIVAFVLLVLAPFTRSQTIPVTPKPVPEPEPADT